MIGLRQLRSLACFTKPSCALVLLSLLCFFSAGYVFAEGTDQYQFHLRTGILNVKVNGVVSNSYAAPFTTDAEWEIFQSTKSSFYLRLIGSYDSTTVRVPYIYTGVGKRFYFGSTGMKIDESEGGDRVASVPRWRYYLGVDLGLSQVVVTTFGTVLQSQSVGLDGGGNIGAIYQIYKNFGLEAQAGASGGLGFTSVAVNVFTTRILLGATMFF